MSFTEDIPNYKSYSEEKFHMNSAPKDFHFWNELEGMVLRAADENGLKEILDDFAKIIPCDVTTNWGYEYLKNDIGYFTGEIKRKVENGKFDVLMDCLGAMVGSSYELAEDVNDFISEYEIGYYCMIEPFYRKVVWNKKEDIMLMDELSETKDILQGTSKQAYEELERAIKTFKDSDDERARKDAVRSCINAMEAVVKKYGKYNEIKQATNNLKSEKIWGKYDIVKDGNSIFNIIHRLYPDVRHGSIEESSMSIAEAEYWMYRICGFMRYLKRFAEYNGTEQ